MKAKWDNVDLVLEIVSTKHMVEVLVNITIAVIIVGNPKIINKKFKKQRLEKIFHGKRSLQACTPHNTQPLPPLFSANNAYLSLL